MKKLLCLNLLLLVGCVTVNASRLELDELRFVLIGEPIDSRFVLIGKPKDSEPVEPTINVSDLELDELRLKIDAMPVDLASIKPNPTLKHLFEKNILLWALASAKLESNKKIQELVGPLKQKYQAGGDLAFWRMAPRDLCNQIRAFALQEEKALNLEHVILASMEAIALTSGEPAIEFVTNVRHVKGQIQDKLALYSPFFEALTNRENELKQNGL